MFHYSLYEFGSLFGQTYTFPKRGDGIGMHTHSQEEQHNVMVMKGSLQIYGPDRIWCETLRAGDIFDLDIEKHHPHEVVALEDDTIMMGMFVNGKPAGLNVQDEDRHGTITTRPVTHDIVESNEA